RGDARLEDDPPRLRDRTVEALRALDERDEVDRAPVRGGLRDGDDLDGALREVLEAVRAESERERGGARLEELRLARERRAALRVVHVESAERAVARAERRRDRERVARWARERSADRLAEDVRVHGRVLARPVAPDRRRRGERARVRVAD